VGVVWGSVIAAIGVLFVVWGRSRSRFIVYRLLAGRSRMLWGERVHTFYQVSGVLLLVVGLLVAILS